MTFKKIHYISGLVTTIFIVLHLFNHCFGVFGAERHIQMMNILRIFYRNIIVEIILLTAVVVQIFSGMKLFLLYRKNAVTKFEKLHIWSGLYLAVFFIIHLTAVFSGRLFLQLDTNFYFGVAGLNSFPLNLFFIPYYGLAIIAFFGHIASIHHKKMSQIFLYNGYGQSKIILVFGICLTIFLLYGLTNRFQGVKIPATYMVLIGK